MRLHKWYYPNLAEQNVKHVAQELVGRILGFPPHVLERKPVKIETVNMPDIDDLVSMIADDGFPEWADIFKRLDQTEAVHAAVTWTKLSYIREISESNYNTVLLSDNVYPLVHYKLLTSMLDTVPDDIYGMNMSYREPPDADGSPNLVAVIDGRYEIFSKYVGTGFHYLFTPEGAGVFLDMWRQMPSVAARRLLLETYQQEPDNVLLHKWYAVNPMIVCWSKLLIGPDTVLSRVDR